MSDDDPEILRPVLARFAAGWGASVDCGEGWWPIIAQLDQDIAAIESAYEVHQIKEKFGGLRFYYGAGGTGNDARIDELIAQAERGAAQTCELCGARGRARGTGWIRTVRRACRRPPRPLAAATSTAASAAARSRCLRAAGDSAEAEQPNGVVVALWAGRRLGGCAHRARLHERRPAGAAPELVLGHDVSVASPVGVVRFVRATDIGEATAQDDVRAIGSGRQPPRRWGADPGRRYGPSPPVE